VVGSPAPAGDGGLPIFATSFVGRQVETEMICGLLASVRLVTITGTGGSGKTRLAHQVATSQTGSRGDGVVWVDLTRVVDDDAVASEVAAACGLAQSPAGVDPLQMVEHHLRSTDRLVVLDNAEHVLDGVSVLAGRVIAGDGRSVLLVTSRESLGVGHEVTWRIPPMEMPAEAADSEAMARASAVQLFCERARSTGAGRVPSSDELSTVAAVCRRLDGIPLAIELAAARLQSMSIGDLLESLEDRLRMLSAGSRSLERQRTLEASIDWSYELLDDSMRTVLRQMAVFVGTFTLADARSVAANESMSDADVAQQLGSLVDKSLLRRIPGGYAMLDSIRLYGSQKCSDAGELDALHERHFRRMCDLAEGWGFGRVLPSAATVSDADERIANLRIALRWGASVDRPAASTLVVALAHALGMHSRYDEINEVVQHFLASVEEGSRDWCEVVAASMESLSMGADWWQAGAAEALDVGGPELEAHTIRRLRAGLALPDLMAGTPGTADELAALIDEARRDDDMAFAVGTSTSVALYLAHNGDLPRAAANLAWAQRHRTDAPRVAALARGARIMIASYECDVPTVTEAITETLATPRLDPTEAMAAVIGAMFSGSRALIESLFDRISRMEFSGSVAFVPTWIDLNLTVIDGDPAAGRRCIESILSQSFVASPQAMYMIAADVVLACGDVDGAREHSGRALDLLAGLDCPYVLAMATQTAAQLDRLDGEIDRGAVRMHVALDLAVGHGLRSSQVNVLENLAVLMFHAEQPEEAARLLGACDAFRQETSVGMRVPYLAPMIAECREGTDPAWWQGGRSFTLDDATDYARRGRGPRGRPPMGWNALTPAETKVVALVVEGLSNQQVADALFVSLATVKTHLTHVFQKLGVKNRTQLVSLAQARGSGSAAVW
jgi:predicted ATPase/DNA-binding CsgD family transcriptional regulator